MTIAPGNDHRDFRTGKYATTVAREPAEQLTLDLSSLMDDDRFDDGSDVDFLREVKMAEASKGARKWLSEATSVNGTMMSREQHLFDVNVSSVHQVQSGFNTFEWAACGDTDVRVPDEVADWLATSYEMPDTTAPAVAKTFAVSELAVAADTRWKAKARAAADPLSDTKEAASVKAASRYDDLFSTAVLAGADRKTLVGAVNAHAIIVARTGSKYAAPPANFTEPSGQIDSWLESKRFTLHLA